MEHAFGNRPDLQQPTPLGHGADGVSRAGCNGTGKALGGHGREAKARPKATGRWQWVTELWRYRDLAYFLAWRDVKVRYKQAALGAAWAILQPLLSMLVLTLFFSRIEGFTRDGVPYALFSFCGLVLWGYFSGVVTQAGTSLIANSNLITKVYFPRITLPLSTALSGLIDLGVGLGVLGFLMLYFGVWPTWSLLLAPVFVATLVFLALGMGMLFSAATVRYRDIKYTIPFLIQLGLFVTPVIYPIALVPKHLQPVVALNPLVGIVEGFRGCLIPGWPIDPLLTAVSITVTVVVFLVGVAYFRTAERAFADII